MRNLLRYGFEKMNLILCCVFWMWLFETLTTNSSTLKLKPTSRNRGRNWNLRRGLVATVGIERKKGR